MFSREPRFSISSFTHMYMYMYMYIRENFYTHSLIHAVHVLVRMMFDFLLFYMSMSIKVEF